MMKALLLIAATTLSLQAQAWETRNDTSYSGGDGGIVSGSTELSGTSRVYAREQVAANAEQFAVLSQVYSVQVQDAVKTARAALTQSLGAAKVATMSDIEVIQNLMK